MNILLCIISVVFFKVFAMDQESNGWIHIDEEIQPPAEQEFKMGYQRFTAENPGPQLNQKFSKLLHDSRVKIISSHLQGVIPILLKGLGESYATSQEQQVIAMYFLNRKKEGEEAYYLKDEQRRQIAAVIMRRLQNPSIHMSQKILEAMLILDTEALRKKKGEYVFKTEDDEKGTAISLNCCPHLLSYDDFNEIAGSLVAYIFKEPLTESERYARYMQCSMWRYTGIYFEER